MTSIKLGLVAVITLGLTGCDDNPFGKDRDNANGEISQSNLDPASVAYFNQKIGDTVLFEVDQSTLTEAGIAILNAQASWLINNPNNSVLVEGHADEQGTREYNLALGARRAASVQSYLVSRGLTDARIRTITYGKERPLAICSDEDCWSKNRRSVTRVEGGLGS